MQKKLIALAIAGLSGAAFAQSNVTVYGVADASYDFISVSGGATSTNNQSFNRVSTNSSLIGFKGSEALGNGLTAVFQYESGVSFDAQGALGATRDSFVGLAGGFGTVAMGNLTGPARALGAALDVNAGATGIGSNSAIIGKLGNLLTGSLDTSLTGANLNPVTLGTNCGRSSTCTSAFDSRYRNAIAYISPDMGGFSAILGYIPNEGKGATATTSYDPSAWELGLKYANGPAMAMFTHTDVKLKNTGSAAAGLLAAGWADNAHAQDTRLGGMYDFGMASVRALWEKTKLDIAVQSNINQTVWGLGATFNAGANGKVVTQYYRAKDLNFGGNLGQTGAKLFELGYEHNLSKRTMLKATYARVSNDTNSMYDFGINASGLAGLVGTANTGAKVSGVTLGLRHSF